MIDVELHLYVSASLKRAVATIGTCMLRYDVRRTQVSILGIAQLYSGRLNSSISVGFQQGAHNNTQAVT